MLDKIDLKIMNILENNSRISIKNIAKECNLNQGTIRNRIEKLKKNGVILSYGARIKYDTIGMEEVILGINIAPEYFIQVMRELKSNPYISELYKTSGDHSAVAMIVATHDRMDELLPKIQKIEGIINIYPAFIQGTVK
ncbi:Lrp/AsnC family transcriptional regulator [Candidatus Marsarchaeota archaeon]|jgi:Lrp/AsnC family transcriptional regulator for asnA, asnC and gidA|nr:Lrp/AsnC family transcriptional regulator [Candidatus Marsarchaeota archaeon]MCL5090315.1 Lrp/AsnC family transcriptional regulator [Candidatus Marsarchaeota archaeon]